MSAEDTVVRALRKDDHLTIASEQRAHLPARNEFDDVEFVHHALDGIDTAQVDLSVRVADWIWASPFYINGMTGGTAQTGQINRDLAVAARETGLPIACGSVSIALDAPGDRAIQHAFTVIRDEHPNGFVMANIGVGRPADDAKRAVDLLQADALQIHLNSVQETVMPEGARDFSTWQRSLASLIAASPVPVIVKEVGFGLSRHTLELIADMGAQVADVNGKGGTDFLSIENARRSEQDGDFSMLSGFGQSALACLLDAPADSPALVASGGVRHPFDAVKALAAGAQAVGVAGAFLAAVQAGGAAALVALIQQWIAQTTSLLALLGAPTPDALSATDILVRGRLAEYCQLRGVDISGLARRSAAVAPSPSHSHSHQLRSKHP